MASKRVIIVGAGPAGLTAAWELLKANHHVTVLERDPKYVGGLSRTMSYKGYRFDVGAHRFFSKNRTVVQWWRDRLPNDFLRIKRQTRILYRNRFFQYPLRAGNALFGLGIRTSIGCVFSYLWRRCFPVRPEQSFEDWVTNHFGDRLYRIFFKTYTEKVWGMPCNKISADWASQRIKGLSLWVALLDAVGLKMPTAKTLVDEFDYPRYGAGMLWERTRDEVEQLGGKLHLDRSVVSVERIGNQVTAVRTTSSNGIKERWPGDEFIVSMPLRDCVLSFEPPLEHATLAAAKELSYRDFILVALIVNREHLFPDNWIYVHDPAVKVGRIENYRNWSKEMAPQSGPTCLEMEYFCSKGDLLWEMPDDEIASLAKRELEQLQLAKQSEILDCCVVRVEKAYPVYDSQYKDSLKVIREALSHLENLQVIGRNGMHKYNNQDHSMMTGILAAENVSGNASDVWRVNGDAEYLEEIGDEKGRSTPLPIQPQ